MTLSKSMSWTVGILATLAIAGIVHILVILSIPKNVTHSAYAKTADFGADFQFNILSEVLPGQEPLPALDPAMTHAVCRFQIEEGPVQFTASLPVPFWSIGLFDVTGQIIYSLNNRTAGSETLSMLLLSPAQLSILRENPPEDLEDLIVIETEKQEGFAILRAFVSHPTELADTKAALQNAACDLLN
ncbi:putative N- transmembrane anchored protein [Roseibium sp. TrichSKD4]|uniref:DUF1254 domain-containing protein n=1 Tax=Roseibium sp. TrichSKD4 TaxID=744980 RepID=UPI0001E5725E|nr:DUF1254 domain-containing protein [Roseibium sp. TrichSKD4]EFO29072.1 putative N- transmembrane anchored protein [Roseibium sp. TrichSKD4]